MQKEFHVQIAQKPDKAWHNEESLKSFLGDELWVDMESGNGRAKV